MRFFFHPSQVQPSEDYYLIRVPKYALSLELLADWLPFILIGALSLWWLLHKLLAVNYWKRKSARDNQYLEEKRIELSALKKEYNTLRLENIQQQSMLKIKEVYDLLMEILKEGGQLIEVAQISKQPLYQEPKESLPSKHLPNKNIFDPPPICPTRSVKILDESQMETVIVLVSKGEQDYNKDCGKFTVVVFNPEEGLKNVSYTTEKINKFNPYAQIDVNVHVNRKDSKYGFDIPPQQEGRSKGATKLALQYVLDRAQRQGIKEVDGPLQKPNDEQHRTRLYCFYVKHFGFKEENRRIRKVF